MMTPGLLRCGPARGGMWEALFPRSAFASSWTYLRRVENASSELASMSAAIWQQTLGVRTPVDPDVWTGGALQEGSVRLESSGLAPMYPAFGRSRSAPGHHGCKRAFDLLLRDKPQVGYPRHQFAIAPGRPLLHRFLSLSQTSAGNGVSTLDDHPLHPCISCMTAPQAFSRPDRKMPRPACAEAVKAGPLQGHLKGSALGASSTMARSHGGVPYAGWDVGSGIFRTWRRNGELVPISQCHLASPETAISASARSAHVACQNSNGLRSSRGGLAAFR